ncbi:MAG: hypothetical protein B0W54_22410 [Cellvibrio sp. 79]|nr:MAG: hypothetical protein B0W54_22410 [Cellvibrio sp. 79]
MDKINRISIPLGCIAGVLLIFLSACDTPTVTPDISATKRVPHVHTVKPGASVKLENTQPFILSAPGVGDLELLLSTPQHDGTMAVDISAGEGLQLESPSHYEFPLGQLTGYKLPLKIRAVSEGRYYINLRIALVNNEQRDHRIITAIVQVGESVKPARKLSSGAAEKNNEEKVISLPAQETISPAK